MLVFGRVVGKAVEWSGNFRLQVCRRVAGDGLAASAINRSHVPAATSQLASLLTETQGQFTRSLTFYLEACSVTGSGLDSVITGLAVKNLIQSRLAWGLLV